MSQQLKTLVKRVPKGKLLQLMKGRSFDTDPKILFYQAKEFPEKYFKIEELKKHIQKRKTKRRKRKRGGGKKLSQSEFKKLISEKEKEYWDEMEKCNRKCNTIKTNYAKNKKKLKKKSKCYQKCNDKRLKNIQSVHKKYPKEYKTFIKNLGGGGKKKRTIKKGRKGPEESATKYPVGTEKKGNDGNMWVINVSKKGIQRWVKKEDKSARGKNKPLEKLWADMSNMKKLVFIMKDGSYQIKNIQRNQYQDQIDKGNNDSNVKVILTAGNSFDGYQQLYDRVKQSSIPSVLKDYKKYWKYKMDDKLYTC